MGWFLLVVFAYLLGSIPVGLVVARAMGREDPRKSGSGNIGATNVGRTLGKTAGIVTLAGDALKGLIPVAWAHSAFGSPWAWTAVAFAAFLGHLFPIYIGFKGGKGVATGLGVFLPLAPGAVLCAAAVFVLVVWKWRMVSLGSLAAAAALPLFVAFLSKPVAVLALAVTVAAFTTWKHRDNIDRILAGTENRLGRTG